MCFATKKKRWAIARTAKKGAVRRMQQAKKYKPFMNAFRLSPPVWARAPLFARKHFEVGMTRTRGLEPRWNEIVTEKDTGNENLSEARIKSEEIDNKTDIAVNSGIDSVMDSRALNDNL
ncbi:hypothetical protein EVAR_33375_1 [Eumeta japonica]|uniref:Uncharacterized protein n=1 Tax=Eumeta variegata TaxID=151549 RepID=A0A4C1X2D8_EUMVA|nr:hypothetical protein EVAR_33375_1 [Eumeta japonica]